MERILSKNKTKRASVKPSHTLLITFLVILIFGGALLYPVKASGATYYVDATSGDDTKDGQSEANAWKTISKVNDESFSAGDSILFKRGETWREQLTVPSSGSAGSPITFGAYGSGDNPIINGSDIITGWNQAHGEESFTPEDYTTYTEVDPSSRFTINGSTQITVAGLSNNETSYIYSDKGENNITGSFKYNVDLIAGNSTQYSAAVIMGTANTLTDYYTMIASSNPEIGLIIRMSSATQFKITLREINSGTAYSSTFFVRAESSSYYFTIIRDMSIGIFGTLFLYTYSDQARTTLLNTQSLALHQNVDFRYLYALQSYKHFLGSENFNFQVENLEKSNYSTPSNVYNKSIAVQPNMVLFDEVIGVQETSLLDLTIDGDWYWTNGILYVYSSTDPAGRTIAAPQRNYGIVSSGHSYITISDIDVRTALLDGISIDGSDNVIIQSGTSFMNGRDGVSILTTSHTSTSPIVRYYNINNNLRNGIYVAGATADNAQNGQYYYNLIYQNQGDGISFNTQIGSVIYNNTIYNNYGNGLNSSAASGFTCKNNIFYDNDGYELLASSTSTLIHSNNSYYKYQAHENLVSYNGSTYTASTLSTFEATGLSSNPLDLELRVGSSSLEGTEIGPSYFSSSGVLYLNDGLSLKRSTDFGVTISGALKSFTASNWLFGTVFVDSRGYIYISPSGTNVIDSERGLWRSTDNASTWSRVIDLSASDNVTTFWGFDEDTNGNLFTGIYTGSTAADDATIYKSTDGGATWSSIFYDATFRHIHKIRIDKKNNYIYATIGDKTYDSIIRSIDGGTTWTHLLPSGSQFLGIAITSDARLFFSDTATNLTVYRTTDDVNFTRVFTSDITQQNFWAQVDPITGYIYAGDIYYGANQTTRTHIIFSTDDGRSWKVYKSYKVTANGYGSKFGSNIYNGVLIIHNYSIWLQATALYLNSYNNFYLLSTSSAIDAGTDVGLTRDYLGTVVPKNTLVDIGAYEYDVTDPTLSQITVVTTPTNDTTPNYVFNTDEAGTISYGGSCSSSNTSASIGDNTVTFNALSDGTYSNCTITVTDPAGNASSPLSISSFIIDTTGPSAFTLSSPANNRIINDSYPTLTWEATSDDESGLNKYQLYIDGNLDRDNISSSATSTTPANALSCGSHTWYVKAVDNAGNSTNSSTYNLTRACGGGLPAEAYMPPTPPAPSPENPEGGFKVLINDDTEITNSRTVILKLFAGNDTERMTISRDPNFAPGADTGQIPYQNSFTWDLCYGQKKCPSGAYTVYVKFFTQYGQSSEVVSDMIVLKGAEAEESAEEMTIQELKAKILEIQQQIIKVLTQLIELIQEQIAQFHI